jgi:hypothetical protein
MRCAIAISPDVKQGVLPLNSMGSLVPGADHLRQGIWAAWLPAQLAVFDGQSWKYWDEGSGNGVKAADRAKCADGVCTFRGM